MIRRLKVAVKHPRALLKGNMSDIIQAIYAENVERMAKEKLAFIVYEGMVLHLDPMDGCISGRLYDQGEWEPDEMKVFRGAVVPNLTVFDVGANIGVYSLWAAKHLAKVHAFEPNPIPSHFLEASMRMNGLQLELNKVCLSDSERDDILKVPPGFNGGRASLSLVPDGRPIQVHCTTIDRYLDEKKIPKVDLMKIDAEGEEPNIIRGGRNAIEAGRIRKIMMEVSLPVWERDRDTAAFLKENYKIAKVGGGGVLKVIDSIFDVGKPWGATVCLF